MYTGIYAPVQLFSAPVPAGPPTAMSVPGPFYRSADLQDGGFGRIRGTVRVRSTPNYPVWRRVCLLDKIDGRLIREQWSDPTTGIYSFDYIDQAQQYVVVAYDHTGVYNADLRDAITPEPMP